jgi:hypothetical protein
MRNKLKPGELRDNHIGVRNKGGVLVGYVHERASQASALRMLQGKGVPKLTNRTGRLEWRADGDEDE